MNAVPPRAERSLHLPLRDKENGFKQLTIITQKQKSDEKTNYHFNGGISVDRYSRGSDPDGERHSSGCRQRRASGRGYCRTDRWWTGCGHGYRRQLPPEGARFRQTDPRQLRRLYRRNHGASP